VAETANPATAEDDGFLHRGVSNVKNFGASWNDFVAGVLGGMEHADSEITKTQIRLTRAQSKTKLLEKKVADLTFDVGRYKGERNEALEKMTIMAEQLRRSEARMAQMSAVQVEKMAKLDALSKKLKDHLNAAIEEGRVQYAAGKHRWVGAIHETRATEETIGALKASLAREAANYSRLQARLDELSRDFDCKDNQRE
jgi:chromosome segregation ATPase